MKRMSHLKDPSRYRLSHASKREIPIMPIKIYVLDEDELAQMLPRVKRANISGLYERNINGFKVRTKTKRVSVEVRA